MSVSLVSTAGKAHTCFRLHKALGCDDDSSLADHRAATSKNHLVYQIKSTEWISRKHRQPESKIYLCKMSATKYPLSTDTAGECAVNHTGVGLMRTNDSSSILPLPLKGCSLKWDHQRVETHLRSCYEYANSFWKFLCKHVAKTFFKCIFSLVLWVHYAGLQAVHCPCCQTWHNNATLFECVHYELDWYRFRTTMTETLTL